MIAAGHFLVLPITSSAAELVMGKTKKCPAAIIKNFEFKENIGNINGILRSKEEDLFR